MNELYWITTVGHLQTLLVFATICSVIASGIGATTYFANYGERNTCDSEKYIQAIENNLSLCRKWITGSVTALLISCMGLIFVPSTTELYAIYGVGTVIDYAQGSKEVQKLPDNAVKALNKWLEEQSNKPKGK